MGRISMLRTLTVGTAGHWSNPLCRQRQHCGAAFRISRQLQFRVTENVCSTHGAVVHPHHSPGSLSGSFLFCVDCVCNVQFGTVGIARHRPPCPEAAATSGLAHSAPVTLGDAEGRNRARGCRRPVDPCNARIFTAHMLMLGTYANHSVGKLAVMGSCPIRSHSQGGRDDHVDLSPESFWSVSRFFHQMAHFVLVFTTFLRHVPMQSSQKEIQGSLSEASKCTKKLEYIDYRPTPFSNGFSVH